MSTVSDLYTERAGIYDDYYSSSLYKDEDSFISILLRFFRHKKVVDLGCGTGLAYDLGVYRDYVGVDVSAGMLSRFKDKHTNVFTVLGDFEELFFSDFLDVEAVLGLYGSPSYLSVDFWRRFQEQRPSAGLLMFYGDGYAPDYLSPAVKAGLADADWRSIFRVPCVNIFRKYDLVLWGCGDENI